ncbi:uncharacterized protein PHACADRAFT_259035 [Phanerochaete carnosa HHB-10118-sp]|uniref:Zn(2)-C6 fungal-type domain-containing protein n=1 Tax=Phanerochaete carnosa (strain HHB-10118-sp) TaxID=650164 RepID=K5W7E4_PHACS|nr:uncharacterized protein PHACADRAFT_259035 [Phanerochaete carnosa HHB-10118-sp]EKM54874.1 hypothetical protein PHACADRAFT_259035 [Phanerochaete carnosa HHB-10118-sp]
MHPHFQYPYSISHPYPASPSAGSFYYASAHGASANSMENTHDVSAVRLAYNQVSASHQYYEDAAGPGVIPYAGEYISQEHWHKGAGGPPAYTGGMHPLPAFYESGEVSPASTDDSSGTFYDSPHTSDDGRLVDERGCGEPQAHACHTHFSGYEDAGDAGYPRGLITAEQYSYPAGQDGVRGGPYDGHPHPAAHMHYDHPHGFADGPQTADERHSAYAAGAPMKAPVRTQSPMAHLPYQETYYYPSYSYTSVEQPQPVYPTGHYSGALHQPQSGPYTEATIAIPARRSPPLVEDAPKKPLTLACFFCRKRKIACGSPPPGKKDRTCNQCARRNLRCEYPVNSRRGTRQRESEPSLYAAAPGYGR